MKIAVRIAGIQPTVLKSRSAWFTWKSNFGDVAYGTPIWDEAPKFPCLAIALTDSNGYFNPHYLWMTDVERMKLALEKAGAK